MTNNLSGNRIRVFSGSMLKLIAVVTMLIDHAGYLFASDISWMSVPLFVVGAKQITLYYIMRKIGRIAFPIFCFLITEGFTHTRNQKRYAINLLLFAFLSEIPFNLMHGVFFYSKSQNVYFTLFLGVCMLYIYENVTNRRYKAFGLFAVAAVAILLKSDYGVAGVLLILMLYIMRENPAMQALLAYPFLSGGYAAWAAFIPINLYNGKRGFISSGILKYAFYLFYPLHMIILVAVKFLL